MSRIGSSEITDWLIIFEEEDKASKSGEEKASETDDEDSAGI
jgi:hypothetical protein